MAETEQGYRVPDVTRIVGISYRQLDYWARTGLVRPSIQDAQGSGTQRLYSFQDLALLKLIKRMLDSGVSLQQIRKAMGHAQGAEGAGDRNDPRGRRPPYLLGGVAGCGRRPARQGSRRLRDRGRQDMDGPRGNAREGDAQEAPRGRVGRRRVSDSAAAVPRGR